MNRTTATLVALASLALAACATDDEPRPGDSVRHMVEGQKHDPAAPRAEAGTGYDGQAAAKALEAYRAGTRPAAKTSTPAILIPADQ